MGSEPRGYDFFTPPLGESKLRSSFGGGQPPNIAQRRSACARSCATPTNSPTPPALPQHSPRTPTPHGCPHLHLVIPCTYPCPHAHPHHIRSANLTPPEGGVNQEAAIFFTPPLGESKLRSSFGGGQPPNIAQHRSACARSHSPRTPTHMGVSTCTAQATHCHSAQATYCHSARSEAKSQNLPGHCTTHEIPRLRAERRHYPCTV